MWPAAAKRRPTWGETILGWTPWVATISIWRGLSRQLDLTASMQAVTAVLLLWLWSKCSSVIERRRAEYRHAQWERKYRLPKRDYTMDEVRAMDGTDSDRPILIVVRGQVFNVSAGAEFYGKDGPYSVFAGRDATWLLAKGELELGSPEAMAKPLTALDEQELNGWHDHFRFKYDLLGNVAAASPAADCVVDACLATESSTPRLLKESGSTKPSSPSRGGVVATASLGEMAARAPRWLQCCFPRLEHDLAQLPFSVEADAIADADRRAALTC